MIIVYHNPKCRKSRAGLEYVRTRNAAVQVRDYIREGISPEEIAELAAKLGLKPSALVRTQEEYYRENLKDRELSDEEWCRVLSENPRLIRRPVVEYKGKAVIADPPEKADTVLN